jgi:hypothetical protein
LPNTPFGQQERRANTARTGSSSNNESRTQGGHKGPDSDHFKENMSSQQSDVCAVDGVVDGNHIANAAQAVWPDKFNEIQYNNPKGK